QSHCCVPPLVSRHRHDMSYGPLLSLTPQLFLTLSFFLLLPPPPKSTLFPYTTLFRSLDLSRIESGRWQPAPEHADVAAIATEARSEEHTSELQSQSNLVCRLLLEKKKKNRYREMTFELQEM